ncbi:MAG: ChaN family lipoprotein [Deltaproteobacteria bacterium]|nr:ChaN family lipoprotein [Deltaproteobacteria bacterium]
MSLSPREELLRLQQRLYRRNKAVIAQSVTVREPGFVRYERRYQRALATYQRVVSNETLLRAVRQADLLYVGDYHTCAQSQRSFLRLLKAVVSKGRPLVIGLELLHRRAQPWVERFLRQEVTEEQFVHRVGLRRRWVFDLWPHFRPLFEFARYHQVPVYGIDAAPDDADLHARDVATGAWVAEVCRRHPDAQVCVLIGDLHLAPEHLPAETLLALAARGLSRRDLILCQNSEAIYWQLAREGREHLVQAVQISERCYCRMHTPPVVCQQSYLNWLEHEEGEIDFADAKHQFVELVQHLAKFVQVPLPADWEDVAVYTCGDLSFLQLLADDPAFTRSQVAAIRRHVLRAESYVVPQRRIVYLANLSLNHAAEEAAHYLRFLCAGREPARTAVDAFFANVLHEAIGFFGSKLINHRRKCWHVAEFRKLLRYFASQPQVPANRALEAHVATFIVVANARLARAPAQLASLIQGLSPDLFFAVTHAIGYMLGDQMFYAVMSRRLGKQRLRDLLCDPWAAAGDPLQRYRELRLHLRGTKIPRRM